jgi:RNA polymerase sigma-70 factor (ECF subfamily)
MNEEREAFVRTLEIYRSQITAHCYRMLGSLQDAEEVAQDTLLRGWERQGDVADERSRRAWLFAIATRECLSALRKRRRRRASVERVGASLIDTIEPAPDRLFEIAGFESPEEAAVRRQQTSLAFVAALQVLSPRQRAALLLVDVLGWSADESARLLETTTVSINSLLQRARKFVAESDPSAFAATAHTDQLHAYIGAWERGDVEGLAALLADDVRLSMPPGPWFSGRDAVIAFLRPHLGAASRVLRFVAISANGQPAVAVYKRAADGTSYLPEGIAVLVIGDDGISAITRYGIPALFPYFGLPPVYS